MGYIGNTANGTLTVNSGSTLVCGSSYVGNNSGVTGTATVTGAGSKWTVGDNVSSSDLFIGFSGNGKLTVEAGGQVASKYSDLGYLSGSTGIATVTGAGSSWTNTDLYVGVYASGTLTVQAGGQISSASGIDLGYLAGSTGVATVAGAGSKWTSGDEIHVGDSGRGVLTIAAGGQVENTSEGHVGESSTADGTIVVTGAGSKWTNGDVLLIGYGGRGTLNIGAGGQVVSRSEAYVGTYSGSIGAVNLDGNGSTWSNSSFVDVGYYGNGTLNLSGGGAITAPIIQVNSTSLLAVDVGTGSTIAGSIVNSGKVRLLAGAVAAANTASHPISWSGSGTCQAVGGKWNSTTQQFTVSPVQTGTSGSPVTVDLAATERILVSDSGSGWSLEASFLATPSSSVLNLTTTAIGGSALADLKSKLDADKPGVAGAWTFTAASGYTTGDPVYLSFNVGAGHARGDFDIWRYNGTAWAEYFPGDLTCNGNYLSFTTTDLCGYAVAAPEPSTLAMLGIGILGFLGHFWLRQKH